MRVGSRWRAIVIAVAMLGIIGCSPQAPATPATSVTAQATSGTGLATVAPTQTTSPTAAGPTDVPATAGPDESPAPLGAAPIGSTEAARVVRVVDGDTIVVDRGNGEERVRYIGVDTPETRAPGTPIEWMGPEATEANRALVDGEQVILERDVSEVDRFGRLLRYVWVTDSSSPSGLLLVNLALVARGYAQVSTYPPDVRYVELYLAAQQTARANGVGLWGPEPGASQASGPTTEPQPVGGCHPSYAGACLKTGAGDYDCAGGSGNGPNYIAGPISVVGFDEFELDRDGDGVACEG